MKRFTDFFVIYSKCTGRALSALAVIMLLLAGGDFSHQDKLWHGHKNISLGSLAEGLAKHSHLNRSNSLANNDAEIHCGGDINFTETLDISSCLKTGWSTATGRNKSLAGIMSIPEPPPPRIS